MRFSVLLICVALLCSCKRAQTVSDVNIVAQVKDRALAREEVVNIIPKGIASADSLLIAESYIKKWVVDELVYGVALRNLGDEKVEIDNLVDTYRSSLFRYRYLERLTKERLSLEIGEGDKLRFYNENQEKFKLDKGIIKGLFLKIPIDAPKLEDVKKWYRSTSVEALGNIEQYSVQNAMTYDYFYDRWVGFDDIISNVPVHIVDVNQFLRSNKSLEKSDSSYCYLLNIKEYIPAGGLAPYEYAEPQVVEMLINQRKRSFLKNFENELFEDAVKNGDVIFEAEYQTNVNKQ